jgi:hypothetical protein
MNALEWILVGAAYLGLEVARRTAPRDPARLRVVRIDDRGWSGAGDTRHLPGLLRLDRRDRPMIDGGALVLGSIAAAATIAYVIATVLVAIADRLGLCWTPAREARRHRDDTIPDGLAERRTLPASTCFRIDQDDPAVRRAIAAPARRSTPLADRRRTRLEVLR